MLASTGKDQVSSVLELLSRRGGCPQYVYSTADLCSMSNTLLSYSITVLLKNDVRIECVLAMLLVTSRLSGELVATVATSSRSNTVPSLMQ